MNRSDTRSLAGRRALVTGSTSGLGFAVADGLAAAGCDVILTGLDPDEAGAAACRDLEERHGIRSRYQRADIAHLSEIERLVDTVNGELGGLDILVNNAVVRCFSPIERMPAEGWDRSIAVNLTAPFHLIRLILGGMRERGFGRIINVSSIYGLIGTIDRADYVTTKTALIGLTRAVALETASALDITCNAVCPGTLPTPAILERIRALADASGRSVEHETAEYLSSRQPSSRFVSLQGVAAAIVFLCGPGGKDVTGSALPLDSGWSVS